MDSLNDAVFAFDKTLEIITTSCYWQPKDIDKQEPPEFIVGNSFASWNLPKLRRLNLSNHYYPIFLRIAPDLISRLPQLTHLTLADKRQWYRLSEITYWQAASLMDLEELRMEGTPAISFNPETLRTTRNLIRMEFRMVNIALGPYPYVPPVQELEECFGESLNNSMATISTAINSTTTTPSMSLTKRPIWTWDWDLPMLTSLFLNAQFAYTFQFKMLARTPNLKNIVVDSRSYSRQCQRKIVLSDFLVPGFHHPSLAMMQDKEQQFQEAYASGNKEDNHYIDSSLHIPDNYFAQEWTTDHEGTQEEELETWFKKFDYVELPALDSFILRGTWTMSRRCLAVLFRRVIPNVKNLMMQGPRGYSGKDFVESSWKYLLRLEESYAALNVDSRAMVEEILGMIFTSGGDFYYRFRPSGQKVVYYFR
ncbi:hypothetical protein BGZ95_004023 [Linnemannia exigua]|uniref:Uncharacterized protein n=1 Tax=Linnemannia exigua TaxID=604196 RepID=A0AAD4D3Y9_9FUNG|nr:hypothetical protein BGZ95_004023 [Linnemannia exigua]